MNTRPFPAALLLLSTCASPLIAQEHTANAAFSPGPLTLTYDHPADVKHWATEGLPIGNGRMGAMLFGGVSSERIQFNEISLWGGANNWDGGYDMSDTGFGGYRNFGDLWISWGGAEQPAISSPSGHGAGNGQGIDHTLDGKADTKWCIENPGKSVSWQVELPKAHAASSYTITSARDVPERDPREWVAEGSLDGTEWKELDRQKLAAPFETRGQTKSFKIAKPIACRFYRLTFTPTAGSSHFQISDITLEKVDLRTVASGPEAPPADYRMSLDLPTGTHRVAFTRGSGAKMTREAFASRPDQVMVFHYGSDKKGALSGKLNLKPGQEKAVLRADSTGISFSGELPNTLKYAVTLRVLHQGGRVTVEGDALRFDQCDDLTLLLDARTDYKPSFADNWRGADPAPQVAKEIAAAQAKSLAALHAAHVADFAKLMDACQVSLGASSATQAALPTPERLRRYVDGAHFKSGGDDPEFEAQIFQMGRYLLASSSRPGGLPANLQGLWNDSNSPAWACDYHNNINVQMNYWPAETTGLATCAEPLVDFIVNQAPACRAATKKAFGEKTRGWTARTSQSPLGGNGWEWNIPASAWYALHVYDHWDFSRDGKFLRETAHPILKEICEYWEDRLKKLPDGTLAAPNGWSPEHGPREDGVMHDQQLIWELFDDYIKAATALGVDAGYRKKVADMQSHLAPNKIGKWGQLQEWQTDRDDPNDRHRHTSHLFALYPGRQISKAGTPDLAKAAQVSLLARSNDSGAPWTPANMHADSIFGWVWPWRAAMWARLGEGDRAHTLIWGKAGNSAPNMLGLNTPYFTHHQDLIQLDNSFGATAAIAEMLLQSHAGEIQLLPALPKAWASQGSFKGLRARGGFTVDCAWKEGRMTAVKITGTPGTGVKIRYGDSGKQTVIPSSGSINLNNKLEPGAATR
ncbi:MAG: glycoside hydrolase N-terminal domain-containing protein [Luteolibacter sp.]